ncbi:MAG: hypothetical protein GY859_05855 [Desulfobacterales bacterium]|nr:hypothetical protein [Desulfobacterales bacterium]
MIEGHKTNRIGVIFITPGRILEKHLVRWVEIDGNDSLPSIKDCKSKGLEEV